MKLHKFLLAGVAAASFAIAAVPSSASADIVFAFSDDDPFDGTGIGANSGVLTDLDTGLSVTLTTVDIIGADESLASDDSVAGVNEHTTNILGSGLFGINTDNQQDDSTSNDTGFFNFGEGWVFSFDQDVTLGELVFDDLGDAGETAELQSPAFTTLSLNTNTSSLGDTFVAAGTPITLTSGVEGTDQGFRVISISFTPVASVPEPSSLLGLMGVAGLIAVKRRRS